MFRERYGLLIWRLGWILRGEYLVSCRSKRKIDELSLFRIGWLIQPLMRLIVPALHLDAVASTNL
jgi:hypothetical protein